MNGSVSTVFMCMTSSFISVLFELHSSICSIQFWQSVKGPFTLYIALQSVHGLCLFVFCFFSLFSFAQEFRQQRAVFDFSTNNFLEMCHPKKYSLFSVDFRIHLHLVWKMCVKIVMIHKVRHICTIYIFIVCHNLCEIVNDKSGNYS